MFFTVLSGSVPAGARDRAFLVTDRWDDWGKYRTQFYLRVADELGVVHDVGAVKIGQVGLRPAGTVEPGQRAPEIGTDFDALNEQFFSLGQGEDYYVTLNSLSEDLKRRVLIGLRDVAYDLELFDAHLDETVMSESLLRDVHEASVRNRFNRITRGDASLTRFHFKYRLPLPEGVPPAVMDFEVTPESIPPTNVHVLIGRNGVGKTRCMRGLAEALLGRENIARPSGEIELVRSPLEDWSFARLVLVSFSAFDDFELSPLESDRIGCAQVGLHRREGDQQRATSGIKSAPELAVDFRKSLARCRLGLSAQRWRDAVQTLEIDDLFAEANVRALIDQPSSPDWDERAEDLFKRLSSGHAIILLTVTRLVELVDERTLVLIDEPEGHLHPPLLSAFIRCLSDLLVKRNGVAIIATHSPVVLQEVPRLCAWKVRRSRDVSVVERPTIETFGENIGLLTREVFGLEVTRAGFHQLLQKAVDEHRVYERVVNAFDAQLGDEARAIVRALIAQRGET
ncbi:AAA family ATPase [Luteimonas sp BLCC-B24]|uniref:AAA family ATPase n=1 Tax=Luteimonas sp. BLCC-B24 TaxID=3025317 RepID=UPI00234D87AA|nr:AAA family ATPase [Luteimonas sp. BLCC-B24]MDC7808000.1 AAA family ATPase [Luteimonas sp. BLCC-B24]